MEQPQTQDPMVLTEIQKRKLSNAITHALEVEKFFRLYSYKIIDHETYIRFVDAENLKYFESNNEADKLNLDGTE